MKGDLIEDFLDTDMREILLKLVEESLVYAVKFRLPFPVGLETCPAVLRLPGASFVTLIKEGELRGCIGTLQAHRPLAIDIARNALSNDGAGNI